MRMGWVWVWFDEQDELRSSRRPCCVSTGKNPLKKYPRPYAARVLLCDRAAAVSIVFALCRHNIKICRRRKAWRRAGAAIPGRRLWRRKAFPKPPIWWKTATRAAFAAVTEHGARVSRTPKQKSKRKTTLRKQLKAKSQASNRAKKPRKSQRAKTEAESIKEGQRRKEPIYNKHKAYKKKKQGYYIAQRLYRL